MTAGRWARWLSLTRRETRIYNMAGQSYFITGGFGFLGQHIVKAIRDHDPLGDLRVLVRTARRTLLGIESLPGVRLVSGDLSQPETFTAEMDGVDTVIHNAALVSFKRRDAEALRQSNIVGTRNLLRAALDHGCRNFVFISSISAIGRQPGRLSDETMRPDLKEKRSADFYGYTKLMGESALQAEAGRIRGIILNPSLVLGPGSRRIEQVVSWLRWIPFFPMLTTLNSFVDVRDVAKAVVLALTEGRSGERYIVTTENVDMLAFTRRLLAVMGKRAPVFPAPGALFALGDALVWLLDALRLNPGLRMISAINVDKAYSAEKIRREMGWQPDYSLEQSLRDSMLPGPVGGQA
ncbi:MAG TPA: NAD-dependent epimerase/dehydratase family protein [Anaerolineales bacterium]|nr:NAD-dependent epimerase/dehydratase family protein [Anaerolineales bacterium]